jgi:hypothetical protein
VKSDIEILESLLQRALRENGFPNVRFTIHTNAFVCIGLTRTELSENGFILCEFSPSITNVSGLKDFVVEHIRLIHRLLSHDSIFGFDQLIIEFFFVGKDGDND